MPVGGDDDTLASSLPTLDGGTTSVQDAELVAGRYRILRWLGGGGMGRVYEALDTELDERVALKVLRAGLSDDALERFRREVKLTRRIQHRNVARMFDIGEHKGEKFLTMELVEGEPLTREVGGKPMSWQQLKQLAEQICAGLSAAHAAGVVHRDLKPDNVLIERDSGRAVITDFGIARSGDDSSVTQVGAIVGTPRYMSPEQLAGGEIDSRADLFSLGVMLFELATGTRPWPGDNAIAIAVSQATSSPATIDTTGGAVPAWFASLVAMCIQLDPGDRPASADDIAATLASGTPPVSKRDSATRMAKRSKPPPIAAARPHAMREPAAPTISEPTSLAVLPIACAAADEYLADGVLEDLTDTLSTTPGLRVRPAGIVRSTTAPDPREVGHRLHVDHVVTATLRRTPKGLRIATRLISVADGFQIWAHKTDCDDAEVLTVADQLARGIAEALSARATSVTKPTDPRAVELYLRARAELRRFWGTHAQAAADLLEQAAEYAPTSAPILSAYAHACVQTWVMRGEPEFRGRAELALERALATGHGEAFLASAQYHFSCNEPERGASDLARALVRAPMSAQTHELAGKILCEIDGTQIARQHFETARGLDPSRTHVIDSDVARIDALEEKWSEVDRRINTLLGNEDAAIQQLGYVLQSRMMAWRGDPEPLRARVKQFTQRMSSTASSVFKFIADIEKDGSINLETWHAALGKAGSIEEPRRQYLMRIQIFAELALLMGEKERGLEAIARAYEEGFMDVTWMDHCPLLARLCHEPQFGALRRQVADRAARVLAAFHSVSAAS
ncbi:MAG TPA: serine/threonine-protein kinase [Kofleriaceae bacterium]